MGECGFKITTPIKTFKGLSTERARLGNFKKNLKKKLLFYSKIKKLSGKHEV